MIHRYVENDMKKLGILKVVKGFAYGFTALFSTLFVTSVISTGVLSDKVESLKEEKFAVVAENLEVESLKQGYDDNLESGQMNQAEYNLKISQIEIHRAENQAKMESLNKSIQKSEERGDAAAKAAVVNLLGTFISGGASAITTYNYKQTFKKWFDENENY